MTESSLDKVTQNGGQFPLLHLSGHLTPDTVRTAGGAQTVVAQRTLNPQKREVNPNYCVNKPVKIVQTKQCGLGLCVHKRIK